MSNEKPHPSAILVDGEWWVISMAAAWKWSHHPRLLPSGQSGNRDRGNYWNIEMPGPVYASKVAANIVRWAGLHTATGADILSAGWRFVPFDPRLSGLLSSGVGSDIVIITNALGVDVPMARVFGPNGGMVAAVMPVDRIEAVDRRGRRLSPVVGALGDYPEPVGGEE